MRGIFLFPRAGFHFFKARTHDYLDVFAAQTFRRTAAVHRRIAATEHNHALADFVGMAERDARQPVDADVDVLSRFLASRQIKVTTTRRASADKYGVIFFVEDSFQACNVGAVLEGHAKVEDVADFFVDHFHRQAETRNLRPDHATGTLIAIIDSDIVAERREVARDRQR